MAVCEVCRKATPDTVRRPDPYEQDLNGVLIYRDLCDDCAQDLADEL